MAFRLPPCGVSIGFVVGRDRRRSRSRRGRKGDFVHAGVITRAQMERGLCEMVVDLGYDVSSWEVGALECADMVLRALGHQTFVLRFTDGSEVDLVSAVSEALPRARVLALLGAHSLGGVQ